MITYPGCNQIQSGKPGTSSREPFLPGPGPCTSQSPRDIVHIAVLDSRGNDASYSPTWVDLNDNSEIMGKKIAVDLTSLHKQNITYMDLLKTKADVIIISAASYNIPNDWLFTDQEINAIKAYIHDGHSIVITGASFGTGVENNRKLASLVGMNDSVSYDYEVAVSGDFQFTLSPGSHPVLNSISSSYNPGINATSCYPVGSNWTAATINGTVVAVSNTSSGGVEAAIVSFNWTWRGVYISYDIENPDYTGDDMKVLFNSIVWCSEYKLNLNQSRLEMHRLDQIQLSADVKKASVSILNYSVSIYNAGTGQMMQSWTNKSAGSVTSVIIPWIAPKNMTLGNNCIYVKIGTLNKMSAKSIFVNFLNAPPVIQIISPVEGQVNDTNPVQLRATIVDADDDAFNVTWYSDGNILGNETNITVERFIAGMHNISLTVTDGMNTVTDHVLITYIIIPRLLDAVITILLLAALVAGIAILITVKKKRAHRLPFHVEKYTGEPFVFISYSHKNIEKVFKYIKMLHEKGIHIWYDEGIPVSEEWRKTLAQKIETCSAFIAFLSVPAVASKNVLDEIAMGEGRYANNNVPFILVYLEDFVFPSDLKLLTSRIQGIEKKKYQDNALIEKIIEQLPDTVKRGSITVDLLVKKRDKRRERGNRVFFSDDGTSNSSKSEEPVNMQLEMEKIKSPKTSQIDSSDAVQGEKLVKLREIMMVSERIKLNRLANLLGLSEQFVWDHIIEWASQFKFKIDDDEVIFGQGNIDAFIDELDKKFKDWDSSENDKKGKV